MPEAPQSTVTDWEQRIGDSVRQARLASEVAQADLADRADVSLKTIGNLEHGRGSSLSTLIRVAQALGRTDLLEGLTQSAPVIDHAPQPVPLQAPATPPGRLPRSRRWRAPSGD